MHEICHLENFYEIIAGQMRGKKRVLVINKQDHFSDSDLFSGYHRLRNDHIEKLSKSGLEFKVIDES